LPQSRHRKINKAKKRPRGMYPTASSSAPTGKNRNMRIIAIVVVAVLALSAVGYVLSTSISSKVPALHPNVGKP
jgi:flagellar basal body-associated protein FliL